MQRILCVLLLGCSIFFFTGGAFLLLVPPEARSLRRVSFPDYKESPLAVLCRRILRPCALFASVLNLGSFLSSFSHSD